MKLFYQIDSISWAEPFCPRLFCRWKNVYWIFLGNCPQAVPRLGVELHRRSSTGSSTAAQAQAGVLANYTTDPTVNTDNWKPHRVWSTFPIAGRQRSHVGTDRPAALTTDVKGADPNWSRHLRTPRPHKPNQLPVAGSWKLPAHWSFKTDGRTLHHWFWHFF